MKKLLIIFLSIILLTTGCGKSPIDDIKDNIKEDIKDNLEDIKNDLEDISNEANYPYQDSKDTVITLDKYNQINNGMTEQEVWDLIGGQCTNISTTDLGIGAEYVTSAYGCNGKGNVGANAMLTFQGGKLISKSQAGLK